MLKTLINSACSKHTRVMEIFHVCALFAKWTAARTTCLMIWRRPSGGLGSKEKLTWRSLPGNSVNAFWDCCSQRWTGLKIRGGMEMRRTFLHRKHTILFCFLVVFLRPMSATLCPFFFLQTQDASSWAHGAKFAIENSAKYGRESSGVPRRYFHHATRREPSHPPWSASSGPQHRGFCGYLSQLNFCEQWSKNMFLSSDLYVYS